jgi:hypothetical protein
MTASTIRGNAVLADINLHTSIDIKLDTYYGVINSSLPRYNLS